MGKVKPSRSTSCAKWGEGGEVIRAMPKRIFWGRYFLSEERVEDKIVNIFEERTNEKMRTTFLLEKKRISLGIFAKKGGGCGC